VFGSMNIIRMAIQMTEAVATYQARVRRFYYAVVLLAYGCPKCNGHLTMEREGSCRCQNCGHGFDPTTTFQRCLECGGRLKVEVRRYRCRQCGQIATSRFLFDGLVFDAEYFRRKMAESRTRRLQEKNLRQERIPESRSLPAEPEPIDLSTVQGLLQALNGLTAGVELEVAIPDRARFDLSRYESHIQAHLHAYPIGFDEIPPLSDDVRLDRIWRFVAIIFMAHAGLIKIEQEGPEILVMHCEAH
jgi:DNA-directed RNA polymerase subunit RPC12/RpoP